MTEDDRARIMGINHVALEVGDIDAALEWYSQLFEFELRGRTASGAFIDMGDQFIALSETADAAETTDSARHVGLVVDDLDAALASIDAADVDLLSGRGTDIRDPWGNRLQLVEYAEIQFTKAAHVLEELDVDPEEVAKTPAALAELADKGMAPE